MLMFDDDANDKYKSTATNNCATKQPNKEEYVRDKQRRKKNKKKKTKDYTEKQYNISFTSRNACVFKPCDVML